MLETQETASGPSTLRHHFYKHPLHDIDYVRVEVEPGKQVHDQPVTDYEKELFPEAWAAYRAGEDQTAGQIKLESQAWIDPLQVPILHQHGVRSVEQLSGLTDTRMQSIKLPHVRKLVEKAKQVVSEKSAAAETDDLKARLAALERELAGKRKASGGKAPAAAKAGTKRRSLS